MLNRILSVIWLVVLVSIVVIILLIVGLVMTIRKFIQGDYKSEKAKRKSHSKPTEDERRMATPCTFTNNPTEEEFRQAAYTAQRKIKRIKSISIDGPVVYATVESQSGISKWDFSVDFNDWGHVTGTFWWSTDNHDSEIPKRFGNIMRDEFDE